MKLKLFFLALIFTTTTFAATIQPEYSPGPRTQLPAGLNQTYLGMSAGYTDIPYSNSDLQYGYHANSFTDPNVGLGIFVGHFFNRYLAAQLSLMRPIEWAYANGIVTPSDRHSIWVSIFGFALRPTLPLTDRLSLYGIGGLGIISRHGFQLNNQNVVASEDIMSFFTGGGITYALTKSWHADLGLQYTVPRNNAQQPGMLYAFAGFYYLFEPLNLPDYYSTNYIFHKNLIQVGTFSTNVFNPDINKYFTVGYLPIFWTGDIQVQNGTWFMYNRNIFHTHKIFSFDIGVSGAAYDSAINNTSFETLSVFPEIRFWFYRGPLVDWYFNYAVAGPTYITRKTIDNIDSGGNFTFQDLMGIGMMLGKNKNFNIDFKIAHYSNGNLLPNNPGIQVPLVVSVGYAFS